GVPEAGAHHFGGILEVFVIIVYGRDRLHAGIFGAGVVALHGLLVPVVDPPDEGRDELHARLGTGDRLRQREEQGHVAADALALQDARGLDALPGGGDLDQHAFAGNAALLIERNQVPRLFDRAGRVEAEPRVGLGG